MFFDFCTDNLPTRITVFSSVATMSSSQEDVCGSCKQTRKWREYLLNDFGSIQVSVQNDCDKCRKETTDNTELIEKKKAELSEVDVTATDAHLQMPLHTVYFGEVDQLLLQKNLKQEFICQSCPFQATSEDKLKIHSETSHDKKKKFAC